MTTTIYQALCACFGLSPSSADASILIREAYQDPENAPRSPRNTDVIYFSIEPDSTASEAPPVYSAESPPMPLSRRPLRPSLPGNFKSSATVRTP